MEACIFHFAQLSDIGIVDTSKEMRLECVRYVYMELLQSELDRTKVLWNTHYIRSSGPHHTPAGKPDYAFIYLNSVGQSHTLNHSMMRVFHQN